MENSTAKEWQPLYGNTMEYSRRTGRYEGAYPWAFKRSKNTVMSTEMTVN